MRRPLFLFVVLYCFMLSKPNHRDQRPIWRIDLHALGYESIEEARVNFCGPFIVVNPDPASSLIFDTTSKQRMAGDRASKMPLASCQDFAHRQPVSPISDRHIVAHWKNMVIEQVCDVESCTQPPGKPRVRNVTYYLERPGKPKLTLFHLNCLPRIPQFVGDSYILVFLCDLKGIVFNTQGERIYEMAALSFPYIAVNSAGTRFAVYERDESFWHELEGTTNRVRVEVYQSSTGKKLLELRWRVNGESTRDGRVGLSDEGSLLAIIRSGEVLVFAIPFS